MTKADPFRDHVHDLLVPLGDVRIRAMFGGYGIYAGDAMFGLIVDDTLYLKVDAQNEQRFVDAKLERFTYHSPKGPMSMGYRQAPEEGLDDGEVLRAWAETAIGAALRAKKAKTKPGAATKPSAKSVASAKKDAPSTKRAAPSAKRAAPSAKKPGTSAKTAGAGAAKSGRGSKRV
jgi:DNA transformation protein